MSCNTEDLSKVVSGEDFVTESVGGKQASAERRGPPSQ